MNLQPCSETATNPRRVSTCVFPASFMVEDWIGTLLGSSHFLCSILQMCGASCAMSKLWDLGFCYVYKNVLFYF